MRALLGSIFCAVIFLSGCGADVGGGVGGAAGIGGVGGLGGIGGAGGAAGMGGVGGLGGVGGASGMGGVGGLGGVGGVGGASGMGGLGGVGGVGGAAGIGGVGGVGGVGGTGGMIGSGGGGGGPGGAGGLGGTGGAAGTGGSSPNDLVSDDFHNGILDTRIWQLVDPQNDSSISFVGSGTPDARLLLSVPAGTVHDPASTNTALRIMQAAADTDFEIEVKFESEPTQRYQTQGLLVEQDASNYLRFDVFSDGASLKAYSASFVDGEETVYINASISSAPTIYLRLARAGNQWTGRYSFDGMTWVTATSFAHALTVTSAGVFAGNFYPNPEYTAVVDYFFDRSSPIVPEDALLCDPGDAFEIATASTGQGSVVLEPEQSSYPCGTIVTLGAEPDLGSMFAGWDGTIAENRTPIVFAIETDISVTAQFVPDTLPPRIRNIQVAATETSATVSWDTDELSIGWVDYGLTPLYELGSVASNTLAATHAVTLPALDEDTHYHYRIRAEDSSGNNTSSADRLFTTTSSSGTGGPNIDVWYGPYQTFGAAGMPQRFINILGKISDADGLSSFTYSFGGALALPLSVGPDGARLANTGDFNVEIPYQSLPAGVTAVTLRAADGLGNETIEVVEVDYIDDVVPSETYSIDWSTLSDVSEAAQIVDGKWSLGTDGVRVVEPGYDRLIAIGDLSWVDYEATVEFTLNAPADSDLAPIVGLAMRWTGHFDWDGSQPRVGWYPLGALLAYTWINDPPYTGFIRWGSNGSKSRASAFTPEPLVGVPHVLKMRGETLPGGDVQYSMKMWPLGQAEPAAWAITYVTSTPPAAGSLLLVAHHLDVTFGDVVVVPVGN